MIEGIILDHDLLLFDTPLLIDEMTCYADPALDCEEIASCVEGDTSRVAHPAHHGGGFISWGNFQREARLGPRWTQNRWRR